VKLPVVVSAGFWRSLFFYLMALSVMVLLIWQLWLLEPPEKWCPAKRLDICFTAYTKNLEIRDHAIIGLMAVLAVVVIGSMVISYGLRVSADGPGGVHVDVQQDKTTVTTPAATMTVPTTPPAGA